MEDGKTYEELVNWKFSCKTKSEHFARIAYIKRIYDKQSMIGEAEMRGEERGREEGREEGIKIGETKALAEMALQLLSVKFERIPKEIEHDIMQANSEILHQMIGNIFTITELEHVRKYLA